MSKFYSYILTLVALLAIDASALAQNPGLYRTAQRRASETVAIPPLTATFNQTDGLKDYTVIDANGDGQTWKYYSSTARIGYNENGTTAMDDWLISFPVKLDAGRIYNFSFTAYCNETYADHADKFEVFIGTEPTVEAMTINVVPVTEVKVLKAKPMTVEGSASVTASGNYYIGIHACSDPDTWALFIKTFSVEPGEVAVVPSAVTNLVVTPDPSAAHKATITFNAPATDADGNALEGSQSIIIARGETVITTLSNVAPGEECFYTDELPGAGTYTYTVTPVIGGSEGTPMSANVYVGIAKPLAPTGLTLVETDEDGIVTLGWNAVTTNELGYEMLPELVSYTIMTVAENPEVIASGIKGTSHTFRAVDARYQTFVEYFVVASTEAGSSAPVLSPLLAAGKPYPMPMDIHVTADGYISHNVSVEGDWSIAPFSTDRNDDGYVFRLTPELNKTAAIGTGKVAIPADARNPVFTFHYYTWKTSTSGPSNDVAYATVNGERVEGCVYPLGASDGWMAAIVPLDAYKGGSVVVGIEVECKPLSGGMFYFPLFDGISVSDPYKKDLAVKSFEAPDCVKVGSPATFTTVVKNIGSEDAGEFEVTLLRNGYTAQSAIVASLAAATSTTVEFAETATAGWGEFVEYSVSINYSKDEYSANNASDTYDVGVFFENYPVATGLTAEKKAAEGTVLTWEAPVLGTDKQEVTETFENCRKFAINDVFEWSFFDLDDAKTYSFGGTDDFPGRFSKMAYIVFDASHFTKPADYAAHDGNKYLGTFASYAGKNDDWAVSPLLCGDEQIISFYAKSYNDKYGLETFEVLATTKESGFTTDDFTIVGEKGTAPTSWKKFSFTLPEGSRHFAIHCISEDKFFFQVDDVTYMAASESERFQIVGYNIYRNDIKLNNEPVTELTFTDAAGAEAREYRVSAVYTDGESRPSNAAIEVSGIINIDAETSSPVYYNLQGVRVEKPSNGIYIIRRGDKTSKVFID